MKKNPQNSNYILNAAKGILFSLFVLTVFISSCTKERLADEKTAGPSYTSASSFYTANQQQEQTFQVDSPGTKPIIGKMGTILSGYDSIFMTPSGQSIYYPYTLKLIEIYPVKDMILSNMPSVGGGNILETGGEIRIRAFKGSTELVLKPGKRYPMLLDTNNTLLSNMKVFYGFANTAGSTSFTDWTSNVTSLDPSINPDNLSQVVNYPLFYGMDIARMGWVNCARNYSNSSPTTPITFAAAGTNPQNIDIFLVFKDIHSMTQVYNLKSQPIPLGTNLTIVAISRDSNSGNTLVYDKQDITVSAAGMSVTLNMVSTTDANLLSILSTFK